MVDFIKELINALEEDNVENIKYLFSKNKSLVNARINNDGDTPIIFSAKNNKIKSFDFLKGIKQKNTLNYLDESYMDFLDKDSIKDSHIIEDSILKEQYKKEITLGLPDNNDDTIFKV